MEAEVEAEGGQPRPPHAKHIKKRALRNKALSVSFNEKDLRDFVGGFHKRKKKRRKEAQQKLQESQRIKRIVERKKRKLERELVLYGGAPTATGSEPDECDDEHEQDDGVDEPIASVSGTTMYDNGDAKVIVTTSEISREEENYQTEKTQGAAPPATVGSKKKHNVPVSKKKAFKRVARHRSQPKLQRKRDKKKGGKKNKKIH
ncbi:hypothetical protein PVL29_012787 [Vitis rotundifolia]|uniref:Ribosomal RNA-processing protein 17 n=1 Tax=Vitis rotundifolia TaxID=103349 RepID=A0AA38ZJM9_VITRO|nr:hypothetical protein PVL29_012787 [Vitis rotundifolia]